MGKNKQEGAVKQGWFDRFLSALERACNKLPPPAILFIYLFVIVAILSCVLSLLGVSVINPAKGEAVAAQNLFTKDGLNWFLSNMVKNFTGFAPLGLVLTMTLAIGMCEESGLIRALLTDKMKNIPPVILPFVIAFVGTCGNLASDTAMVVIPPIAAILYLAAGKHPVVGMICGYAGAQAGFSANLMIAGTDSLLQGITNTALNGFLGEGKYAVDVTCNWIFMFASTFMCALVIGWVCNWIVDKRFGKYEPNEEVKAEMSLEEISADEKKGLRWAGISCLIYLAIVLVLFFFGPLAKIDDAGKRVLVGSPLISNLIPVLFFFFTIPGLVFGFVSKKFKESKDVVKGMNHQMAAMGSYVVFCFFCGQFQALFNWTNLGTIMAVAGANLLKAAGFTGFGMIVAFILLTGLINLLVPSGSAKWAILAPVFVPMLMLLGYHPGFIQLIYRLGDSPTNAFTPLSPYIWVTLGVAQVKYDKDLKIGTFAAGLFPIGIMLQIAWIIFLAIWMLLKLPIGPGVGTALPEELAYLIAG
ncbi:MAG: AbgT family transporter [Clostridia bacterium]|nr:AbgT family transporter [Clostridia bacterium]